MNKKYPNEYVRCLGLQYLNEGLSLAALSRSHNIPYDTVKFFKKKGFYFCNFKDASFSENVHFLADGKRIVELRRRVIKPNHGPALRMWTVPADYLKRRRSIYC